MSAQDDARQAGWVCHWWGDWRHLTLGRVLAAGNRRWDWYPVQGEVQRGYLSMTDAIADATRKGGRP